MKKKSNCRHRYTTRENAVFTTEEGLEVFVLGGNFQVCSACGHVDFPLGTKELIEAKVKEKHLFLHKTDRLCMNLADLG